MNLFLYLLAGHLIGDFALQTGKIATMKREGLFGLVVHVAIVTLVTLLLVIYMPYGWEAALLVGAGHFIIDAIRTYPLRNMDRFPLGYFLVDQGAHLLLLVGVANLMASGEYTTWMDYLRPRSDLDYIILILSALVFLIFTIPVIDALLLYSLRKEANGGKVVVTMRARLLGAIERVIGFYLMFTPAICITPLVFLPHFLYRFGLDNDDPLLYRLLRPTISLFLTLIVGWLVLTATRAWQ